MDMKIRANYSIQSPLGKDYVLVIFKKEFFCCFVFNCLSFVCIMSIILEQSNTVLLSKTKPFCVNIVQLFTQNSVLLYMDYSCI